MRRQKQRMHAKLRCNDQASSLRLAMYGSLVGMWVHDRTCDGDPEQRGGMLPLDPNTTPSVEDLKGWLWASYPLHLSQAIYKKASSAHAELSVRVEKLLDEARQEGLAGNVRVGIQQ